MVPAGVRGGSRVGPGGVGLGVAYGVCGDGVCGWCFGVAEEFVVCGVDAECAKGGGY